MRLVLIAIVLLALAGIVYWIKLGAPSDKEHKWWKLY
jgi:hypothetical protein